MKKIFTIIILAILLCGCSYSIAHLSLKDVIRSGNEAQWYGESKTITLNIPNNYGYEDAWIRIIWTPMQKHFFFVLENKSDQTMKILWDEAVYIDENNNCRKVAHSDTRLINVEKAQVPTIIVRNSKVEDIIYPTNKVYYVSGKYGGWRQDPLFPRTYSEYDIPEIKKRYVGKIVKILLPIQIQNTVNEYIFCFEIDNFTFGTRDSNITTVSGAPKEPKKEKPKRTYPEWYNDL